MTDSFAPPITELTTHGQAIVISGRNGAQRILRPLTLVLACIMTLLVCSTHAMVAGANTPRAAGVGYLCLTVVFLGCAFSFWFRSRAATGTLHIRWSLTAGGALAAAIGYLPSFAEPVFNIPPARVFAVACFNASEALYILAAVLFFAGVARSIVLVDMLQALLFILLRFNLIYSPITRDHFAAHHLVVGQLVALFMLLVALVACLGAASRAELSFLRTLSWFFGLRLVSYFLANQISYTWLHYVHCSLWDVPATILFAGFSICMLYTEPAANTVAAETTPRKSSLMVRSLMPSFLALVNLMLSLILMRVSVTVAAVAISVSLVCYVVRTGLLHSQELKDKARLETHNEHLEGLAVRDPLTGIGNRRSLAEVYGRLQTFAGGERLSLMLADIDHFKQANDSHGHQHGDKVLVAVAAKLQQLAAGVAGSHCARLGGDEFALLLPHVTPQVASLLAEELRAAFSANRFEARNSGVTLSIGIASVYAARELALETLASFADEALYRAKQLGRNRVEVQPICDPASGSVAPNVRLKLQHIVS